MLTCACEIAIPHKNNNIEKVSIGSYKCPEVIFSPFEDMKHGEWAGAEDQVCKCWELHFAAEKSLSQL